MKIWLLRPDRAIAGVRFLLRTRDELLKKSGSIHSYRPFVNW